MRYSQFVEEIERLGDCFIVQTDETIKAYFYKVHDAGKKEAINLLKSKLISMEFDYNDIRFIVKYAIENLDEMNVSNMIDFTTEEINEAIADYKNDILESDEQRRNSE